MALHYEQIMRITIQILISCAYSSWKSITLYIRIRVDEFETGVCVVPASDLHAYMYTICINITVATIMNMYIFMTGIQRVRSYKLA
jgi:hypothetical protein